MAGNLLSRFRQPVLRAEDVKEAVDRLNSLRTRLSAQLGRGLETDTAPISVEDYAAWRDSQRDIALAMQAQGASNAAAIAPRPEPLPATPQSTLAVATDYDAEYAALADQVGFSCPELLEQKLLNFLHENGYSTYDYDRVKAYMDALVTRLNAEKTGSDWSNSVVKWLWRPLRQRDSMFTPRERSEAVYARPVPMPVLQTVAEISAKLSEARFHVTDYVTFKPDPFLAVSLPGMTKYVVIERWDEPSFR